MVCKIIVAKLSCIIFIKIIQLNVKNILYLKTKKTNAYEKKNACNKNISGDCNIIQYEFLYPR